MGVILTVDDFVVKPYSLAVGPDVVDSFTDMIREDRQHYWIKKLLGEVEGQRFIDNIDEATFKPTDPDLLKLHNGFSFPFLDDVIHFSGIKRNLMRAFFKEWSDEQPNINLETGNVTLKTVAAEYDNGIKGIKLWNELVRENLVLACYMTLDTVENPNATTFPNYTFQALENETTI